MLKSLGVAEAWLNLVILDLKCLTRITSNANMALDLGLLVRGLKTFCTAGLEYRHWIETFLQSQQQAVNQLYIQFCTASLELCTKAWASQSDAVITSLLSSAPLDCWCR